MPLPSNNTAWPPASAHTAKLAEWSAWYSGDPDELGTYYGHVSGPVTRDAQYRGGVVGRVARWWWGQPTPAGEQRAKLHVPLAADICGTSADLLFSEQVALTYGDRKGKGQAFLEVLQDNGLDAKLHEAAEVCAGLGGVYLRTVWDSTVSPVPWTEVAHPDGAVPTFRNGRLRSVDLWTELDRVQDGIVHRLVETHEPGVILYGLYAGTASNLGKSVPLPEHPATAHLAAIVDENAAQATGIDRLTVTYVPNMLPNRLDRRSLQGRSDLQGIEPWLDALDEAYSSWQRDIRHAKSRIHVPRHYLETGGPGESAVADVDRELYVTLDGVLGGASDRLLIEAQQFDIRVAEHRDTCEFWTNKIIESAGYSTQSLSSGTGGAVTAAEVHSHERRSYMTRGKKVRYWRAGIREHLATMADIANLHLRAGLEPADIGVEFPDGVQESAMQIAQTAQALRNAEAASTDVRVRMVHPDWDDDQVADEVAAILAETGQGVPLADPEAFNGAPVGPVADDPAKIKAKADALGVLIRSGVDPMDAAERVGLSGVDFTGAVPVSLRLPEGEAGSLEDK